MNNLLIYRSILSVFSLLMVFSCSDDDSTIDPINNEYELEAERFVINTNMYWVFAEDQGGSDHIRLLEPLPNSALFDLIMITPVPGPTALEGAYTFSKTGDIGTYNLELVHATDGIDELEWYTNGDQGEKLEIQSMGKINGQEIYRIVIPDFALNFGYWDYLAGKWVSLGQKSFRLSYEGPID